MAREAEGGTTGAELGWESPWAHLGAILSSSEPAGPGSSGIKIIWGILELSLTFSQVQMPRVDPRCLAEEQLPASLDFSIFLRKG